MTFARCQMRENADTVLKSFFFSMGEIFIPFWHQKFHIRTLLQKISDVFFILFYRKCTGRIQEHSALFQHIRRIEQLNGDQKLVVEFDSAGVKTLLAKFAKLTKLG